MDLTGIFGGAFNPPHKEHIRICTRLKEEFALSRILLVPSKDAPHKATDTSFESRCAMIELSIKNIPYLALDTVERNIEGTT
ncbi:MAG: nicotinate-nicotinamide nucleotide adenylyltransferase, partial [Clostridia bacterium]|nr:nicotinate-nicotinamide nucleotide adenylyltransferase [Clostridia bacterium]